MLRDELVEAINNGYAYIPAERLVDAILALMRKLVSSKRVKRGTNYDFIINGMVDDLLSELK